MPVFEIEGADGRSYEVDAPDAHRAAAAIKKMGGFSATALDVGKTIPSKLVQGTTDLIGLPGDFGDAMRKGSDWLAKKLFDITPPKRRERMTGLIPTSATLKRGVESFTGPLYEPQTDVGRYAGTAARFALAALAGPGGVARNLARYALAPGLAFEGATDVAKGTPLEP